mmetsp:Transcript_89564/g.123630  ORF Transcript_89564/g.123630 Transcript_89564/m.123630 type:complete len:93 (-) Transcript_89564:866-1144(-)
MTKTGFLGALVLYPTICVLNTYTMSAILRVAAQNSRSSTQPVKSYSDLATRLYGRKMKAFVAAMIFFVQFGCCLSYLYFISEQIQNVFLLQW